MDKEKWLKIQLFTTRMETSRIRPIIPPILSPLIAIAAALSVGAILIIIVGKNPLEAYGVLFQEAIANYYGFGNTLTKTTPLLLTSLGVLVALKAGQLNIGGEGQIYMGGLGSALIGIYVKNLPTIIHLPLTLFAGFLFGGMWGWIPGYLKAVRGVNEVITTLLLNYVAQYFISYLVTRPMMQPGAPSPFSPQLLKSAQLPTILPRTQAHAGILIALFALAILWVMFMRSPLGYQIEAVGQNPVAARYAGMPVSRTIMLAMAFGGGLAGLAGASEVTGLKYRLFEDFSGGYGFDAIAIAFLSRGSFLGILLTSLFFGALRSGANVMQRSADVPLTIVYAIQGLTVLFIAISLALENKKFRT
jgi:simple sugar transport system permease protein